MGEHVMELGADLGRTETAVVFSEPIKPQDILLMGAPSKEVLRVIRAEGKTANVIRNVTGQPKELLQEYGRGTAVALVSRVR